MIAKKIVIIGGAIVFLVVVALAVIPFFVDTHSLKNRLVAEAEGVLKRRMSVQSLEITVFTGPGIRLNRAIIFDLYDTLLYTEETGAREQKKGAFHC